MEATSISGLEAMAASRPIVGTTIGGITELVEPNHNGFLVEAQNASSLASGLLNAQQHPNLEEMGRHSLKRVQQLFTWERTAQQINNFYQTLLH